MMTLIKKFSLMFIIYILLYAVLLFYFIQNAQSDAPNPNDMGFVYVLSPYLIWVVIGALWSHEQMERKTQGYRVLAELPVKSVSIIFAKFFWIFITTLIITAGTMLLYNLTPLKAAYLGYAREYTLFFGSLALLAGGVAYLFIFRFGYPLFQKCVIVFLVLVLISPILLHMFVWKNLSSEELIIRLTRLPAGVIFIVILIVFPLFIPRAVRLKEIRGESAKG